MQIEAIVSMTHKKRSPELLHMMNAYSRTAKYLSLDQLHQEIRNRKWRELL